MDPIFTIDIGAGTTDILVYQPESGEHFKAITISPIKRLTQTIRNIRGDIVITGSLMGGGAVSAALIEHARSHRVFITPGASRTVSESREKVGNQGISVVSGHEARQLQKERQITHLVFGDVSPPGLRSLLDQLGLGLNFTYIAGAVQDHGVPLGAMGALDFRHHFMKEMIERNPRPESLLFPCEQIPRYLTRMQSTARLLEKLSHQKLFMMDTGAAAIVGASLDPQAQRFRHLITVDIGNSHTLAAVLTDGKIGGFFEYHTNRLTSAKLEELLITLGNGTITHGEILAQGGHGAYIRECPGFDRVEQIIVTGPRRREMMEGVKVDYREGSPLGDNMMTGTVGLLECINRHMGLGLRLSSG